MNMSIFWPETFSFFYFLGSPGFVQLLRAVPDQKKQIFGGGSGVAVSSIFWKNDLNFMLDDSSRLELISVGSEDFEDKQNVFISDSRIGKIEKYYTKSERHEFEFFGSKDSVFGRGPDLEPELILGVKLPNLSKSPLGLIHEEKK